MGFQPTGEFYQLNSYENRVFDIRMENGSALIAKFYRPGRWTKEAIAEEHEFLFDLREEGIHVVPPLVLNDSTIIKVEDMWASFFPKIKARMPDELLPQDLRQVGVLLARLHNVGSLRQSLHRPVFHTGYYGGWQTLEFLQEWIAPEVINRYNDAAELILNQMDQFVDERDFIRIHGDCHRGNLLNNGHEYFLIDFDDFGMGPAIQDFWMLLSGDPEEFKSELNIVREGYEQLREFPDHQLDWVPLYRGLRIISYAGWIAKRWEDPSFPRLFPDFNSFRYWADETEAIEKIAHSLR